MRTINKVVKAQKINMGGHILDQPLPYNGIEQIDPFLLIHHWDRPLLGGQKPQEVGVGPHPHRGFSPVTFVFKGTVQHRDSLGNIATVSDGGTQWMHAGRGITHSERPDKASAENGGDQEFIQFWVNSPAKYKMETPYYLPISDEDTPKITKGNSTIAVVAGEFEGIKGPAKTYSPMTLLRGTVAENEVFDFAINKTFNTILYLLDGEVETGGHTISGRNMIWYNNDGDSFQIKANKNTRFIVLSGEPIGENVESYGPFVMNTPTEIMEAMRDAQKGKMGILIEEF